jgi:hypothetical protein
MSTLPDSISKTISEEHRPRFRVPDSRTFVRLMQGVGLSHVSGRQEPFELVLQELGTAYEPRSAQIDLAKLAADHLNKYVDGTLDSSILRQDQFVYNTLQLCSGLSRPEELWEPLFNVYKNKGRQLEVWDGKPLNSALRSALLRNQRGPQLRTEWMKIRGQLCGGRCAVVRGAGQVTPQPFLPAPKAEYK